MLTTAQIEHFRTFGFAVLPGLLGQYAEALRHEVDAALRDAYAASYDDRVIDGISGHYLPMASVRTPVSAMLVCDDPVLIDAAQQLLGAPLLPSVPEGVLYFAEAGWHNDDGIGVGGVKLATYFEPLDAAHGALRFVPCSHHPDAQRSLCAYQHARYQECPGVAVETSPGDVIALDLHTFHASVGGRDRLAWTIEYLAEPGDGDERDKSLRWLADGFEQQYRGFDRERYPTWRDWLADAPLYPRRAQVAERLRGVGALELPGAEIGW
jgi:Phytanoyl-CoA dioxygenase (PhyH)